MDPEPDFLDPDPDPDSGKEANPDQDPDKKTRIRNTAYY